MNIECLILAIANFALRLLAGVAVAMLILSILYGIVWLISRVLKVDMDAVGGVVVVLFVLFVLCVGIYGQYLTICGQ